MKVPELADLVDQVVDAANEKIDLYVRRYRTTDEFNTMNTFSVMEHITLFGNSKDMKKVWDISNLFTLRVNTVNSITDCSR
jgi:hypothetical protein